MSGVSSGTKDVAVSPPGSVIVITFVTVTGRLLPLGLGDTAKSSAASPTAWGVSSTRSTVATCPRFSFPREHVSVVEASSSAQVPTLGVAEKSTNPAAVSAASGETVSSTSSPPFFFDVPVIVAVKFA